MRPKKKSSLGLIIGAISFVAALYIGCCAGMAMSETNAEGYVEGMEMLQVFLEKLTVRLSSEDFSTWFFDETVKKSIGISLFAWLIIVLMLTSNNKNYIHGKEYGTAKWGTASDIRDLFTSNIMAAKIKAAKLVKNKLSRYFLQRKTRSEFNSVRNRMTKGRVSIMKERQEEELLAAKDHATDKSEIQAVQKRHAQEREELNRTLKEETDTLWREMWEPAQIDHNYQLAVAEIEESAAQGIAITPASKQAALDAAKKAHDEAMQRFCDVERQQLKIKQKFRNADALLTATERTCLYNYCINNNILIYGGSGSGKTRSFVMPNLLQAHSSFVVTDPKGEILEKAGHFLKTVKGYKIKVLNLDNKAESNCYNPFKYIYPERPGYEERILSLIEAMIANTNKGEQKGSSDPFWDNAEKLFLQAIFFFVADGFVEAERNMNTVLELIAMLEIGEERDNKQSDLDLFAERFEERLNAADTVNHNAGTLNTGVQAWKEFRNKASGKTAKSIVITAVSRLSPFRTSGIRRIFDHDDMELDRLGEEKMAIFVVVPPTDTTFNFIAGMMFTQMFQELQYCATQVHKHEGQRLPVMVRFILDEFANTCVIPNFTKILAYARSFGIGIVPILQSQDQLKTAYKDEWGVIIDNCSALLYLGGITSNDTLEYMSKLIGKGTFDKRTTGRTRGKSGSSSENFDVIGRELMTPDEIRRMPKDECILVINGRKPFYSKKNDYLKHPNYCYTSDGNHEYSYYHDITDSGSESTHGEEPDIREAAEQIRTAAKKKAEEIVAEIDKEVDRITLDVDVKNVLSFVTSRVERLQPLSSEVDDGEIDAETAQLVVDCLIDTRSAENDVLLESLIDDADDVPQSTHGEEVTHGEDIVAAVSETVEMVKDEAQAAADAIVYTDEPQKIGKFLIERGRSLTPISCEVDDGEENPNEQAAQQMLELDAESKEMLQEQDIGDMSSMIDNMDTSMLDMDLSELMDSIAAASTL